MAMAAFHAAPSKGQDFKGCTGLALGSQSAFRGAGDIIRMALLQEGRRSCRNSACTNRGDVNQAASQPCALPSQQQGSPAGHQRARTQADHGITDVSREVTEALEWDVTSPQPRSDPSGTLSSCHQGIVADIIR